MTTSPDPWDRFWASKSDLDAVYASSPKVVGALLDLVDPDGARILEIGAGTGRDSATLAARGARVVAVDASPESLELLARAHPGHVGRGNVGGDAIQHPFEAGAFDAVFH
ncbi:MAG: class I SAM-dependent methyltransferase [Gemmatimonadota bacterium]|nr:class I SAM-dependent methyltransferase [Gemmatimonadota bacterium]